MTRLAIGFGLLLLAAFILGTMFGKRTNIYFTKVNHDWQIGGGGDQHPQNS